MSGDLTVRVMVPDTWDEVALTFAPTTPLVEVKRAALAAVRVPRDPAGYVLKYRGAEMFEEGRSLAEAGVVANAPLIVLPRRRRPVR